MTLDDRARRAGAGVQVRLSSVETPEFSALLRRHDRRRFGIGLAVGAAALAVGVLAASVIWWSSTHTTRVATGRPPTTALPVGSQSDHGWALVPKQPAGLGSGSSFAALASNGRTLLLAGADSNQQAMIWRSNDGLSWSPAHVPPATGGVTGIAVSGNLALAVGSENSAANRGMATFVWRSSDGGAAWTRVAQSANVFGLPAPQMGRPFITALTRFRGYWVASGGASSGYAGIWVSTDGSWWTLTLGANQAGSADVVPGAGGGLFAYWVTSTWTASTPTSWTVQTPAGVPSPLYLQSVAPGASVAVAGDRRRDGPPSAPTPLLRSDDGGRTWMVDPSFNDQFPDATAWTITQASGVWVAAGYSGHPNHPDAWVSADAKRWSALPSSLYGEPGGTLSLIGAVDGRIVLVGTAPELDRYYVLQAAEALATGQPPTTSPAALTPSTVPLQSVDWQAISYPIVPDCGAVGTRLGYIAYATPVPDAQVAILTATCNAGAGSPPSAVFVYDSAFSRTQPHLAQTLVSTQDDWHADQGVVVNGPSISIPVAGYSGASPRCCPDVHTTLAWTWTGSSYRETSQEPAHSRLPH